MSSPQQQMDAICGRPTVTVPLADYDRLRRIEERARNCLQMTDLKIPGVTKSEAMDQLDAYARQFVAYILEGR